MDLSFCRRCGEKLTSLNENAFSCTNNHQIYRNPVPCVGVYILSDDKTKVTLSVRGIEPHKGMLDTFGGFVDIEDSSFEMAARRELEEELLISEGDYSDLHYLTSARGNYPFGNESLPVLGVLYWVTLKPNVELTPSDDVASCVTLPLHEIDLDKLHDVDVKSGIVELQKMFPSVK